MNRRIDISHKTVFFIAGFIGALWILFLIKDVILLLFVAIILMSALAPLVEKMTQFRVPKALAITISYISILSIIIFLISLIVTPLVTQTSNLVTNLPQTFEHYLPALGIEKSVLQDQISKFSTNAITFTLAIFSNFLTLISVAVLTFYLLLDRERVYRLIVQIAPSQKPRTEGLIHKIENKLGAWLRGQVLLSLVIGFLSYALLFLLNIPYALPLAILAGIMEVIPVIGPIISSVPAILIAFVISPPLAAVVAVGYFAIQQLENHLIVPQVMKKAVGLNPLVVILAIAVGGRLLGISGALLAVPITVVIQVVLEELLHIDLETPRKI